MWRWWKYSWWTQRFNGGWLVWPNVVDTDCQECGEDDDIDDEFNDFMEDDWSDWRISDVFLTLEWRSKSWCFLFGLNFWYLTNLSQNSFGLACWYAPPLSSSILYGTNLSGLFNLEKKKLPCLKKMIFVKPFVG